VMHRITFAGKRAPVRYRLAYWNWLETHRMVLPDSERRYREVPSMQRCRTAGVGYSLL